MFFFFNDTATTEIYTLSLHDALPISLSAAVDREVRLVEVTTEGDVSRAPLATIGGTGVFVGALRDALLRGEVDVRSEEHTSELQSRQYLVCRLLLEKKKKNTPAYDYN